MGSIVLSDEQSYALERIRAGSNVLVTGKGGSGKSLIIKEINDQNSVLVAPTGVASLLINGATAHRTFGLPLGVPVPHDFLTVSRKVRDLFSVYSPVKRIILDECSMLRADMLELIDAKLKLIRGNNLPFGNIQLVLTGDFFQLDSFVAKNDEEAFYSQYSSPFNFNSKVFDFEVVELTKSFRQSDTRQAAMLDSIRRKDKNYRFALDTIVKEAKPYVPNPDVPVLCAFKKDVRKYNHKYFRKLETPLFEYKARIEHVTSEDGWSDSIVPHTLKLKEGAKVIFKANCPDGDYVNGERGQITYLDSINVRVKKLNGKEVLVKPHTWEKFAYANKRGKLEKDVVSKFTHIPLDLGYAISIHSAQGSEFDEIAIDFGDRLWAHGQAYVALSRAKDLKKLSFVRPPHYEDIVCAKEVKEFYRRVRGN